MTSNGHSIPGALTITKRLRKKFASDPEAQQLFAQLELLLTVAWKYSKEVRADVKEITAEMEKLRRELKRRQK